MILVKQIKIADRDQSSTFDFTKEHRKTGILISVYLAEKKIIDGRNFLDKKKLQEMRFKCITDYEAICINLPTEKYDYDEPDEFRADPHSSDIPYDWNRKDG